jgi:hypothetical protein
MRKMRFVDNCKWNCIADVFGIGKDCTEGKGKPVHKKEKSVSKLRKVLSILAEDHDDF